MNKPNMAAQSHLNKTSSREILTSRFNFPLAVALTLAFGALQPSHAAPLDLKNERVVTPNGKATMTPIKPATGSKNSSKQRDVNPQAPQAIQTMKQYTPIDSTFVIKSQNPQATKATKTTDCNTNKADPSSPSATSQQNGNACAQ